MRPTTIERSPEMAPGVGAEIWKCTGEPSWCDASLNLLARELQHRIRNPRVCRVWIVCAAATAGGRAERLSLTTPNEGCRRRQRHGSIC